MMQALTIQNLLSFPSTGCTLELRKLNVLVGPNGVGKSNLLEILALLRALPGGIHKPLQRGGALEWFHDGHTDQDASIRYVLAADGVEIKGSISLYSPGSSITIMEETLEFWEGEGYKKVFSRHQDRLSLVQGGKEENHPISAFSSSSREASILEALRYPFGTREAFALSSTSVFLSSIFFFRNWTFGPASRLRAGVRADELTANFLEEDASNLANMLHELRLHPGAWQKVKEALQKLYAGCDDIHVSFTGGVVQIFVLEGENRRKIPASRLSDGTLRYLALVTILCHPEPPPLLCVEEPELGLHPDLMPTIANLLKEASERTQLVVTTHSEGLIDALSESPEDVVVCEPGAEGTEMHRLDREDLREWLGRYRLGQLWRRGDIGGNRW
ncbi:MAG: AAA family ATPase [Polyangiaceae bacterium]|jgi:predicted ATPase|nr:AAA family ATPase [Polyangiaceae bacterium]